MAEGKRLLNTYMFKVVYFQNFIFALSTLKDFCPGERVYLHRYPLWLPLAEKRVFHGVDL